MSSAILYAAIVAIWIGVLVPRWLRHDHARDGHLRLRRFSSWRDSQADEGDAGARAGFSQEGRPRYTSSGGPATAQPAPASRKTDDMAQLYEAHVPAPVQPYGWSAEEYLRQERSRRDPEPGPSPAEHTGSRAHGQDHQDEQPHHGEQPGRDEWLASTERAPHAARGPRAGRPPRPHDGEQPGPPAETVDSERRAQVVRGRRRMLWMLLLLTAIAVGLAYLGLAAWWIIVPPTVVLLGYLLLLREAAHADAEARERAATLARRAREAEAQRAREAAAQRAADVQREQDRRAAQAGTPPGGSAPVWTAHETLSHAEIIDISERVGDQLYDQYADAKLRAVGD